MTLCGHYLCKDRPDSAADTGSSLESWHGIRCNGKEDCVNTKLDEEGCGNTTDLITLPSGFKIKLSSDQICNDKCEAPFCEDEASCNGYHYGMYCKTRYNDNKYISTQYICGRRNRCVNGEDEAACLVTNNTQYTCTHVWAKIRVPITNYTRCGVPYYSQSRYCKNFLEQTNCTDPARVGLTCQIKNYISTVSKYMICAGNKNLCDDGLDNKCIYTSHTCHLHKHMLCDGNEECTDRTDENNPICSLKTEAKCERRVGNGGQLTIPLSWIDDGFKDCVNGEDEIREIWPTCGTDKTHRLVTSNETCENVFVCKSGSPGYIEYKNLCDGVENCGNENEICSQTRGYAEVETAVVTENKGLNKNLSYCLEGLQSIQNFTNQCVVEHFINPEHEFFGINTKTAVLLPGTKVDCNHLFGEHYLYTSCTGRCINSTCPLKNIPRYEHCPDQFLQNRVGTLANNKYLALFTKSFGNVYTNNFFVCDNKTGTYSAGGTVSSCTGCPTGKTVPAGQGLILTDCIWSKQKRFTKFPLSFALLKSIFLIETSNYSMQLQ